MMALTTFGIREARFEAATGFWLNGKNLKLKGVCLHHDAGGLGAAVPLRAWERRLELLKQVGCNAIRTAHNPPRPRVPRPLRPHGLPGHGRDVRLLDRRQESARLPPLLQGMVERLTPATPSAATATIRASSSIASATRFATRPRPNWPRPSCAGLVEVFHENDPTRPVTQALFRPNVSHDYDNGLADLLDVIGQNYRENEILAAHKAKPTRKILGTENGHDRKVWLALRDNPPYAGQFLWTGFDYLGESRRWPVVGAGSGLFDRTGAPRPRAFQRQSWWSDQPDGPHRPAPGRRARHARRSGLRPARPAASRSSPTGRREIRDRTTRLSRSIATASRSNCCSTASRWVPSLSRPTPRPAPGRWLLSPARSRPLAGTRARWWPAHELRTAGKAAKILLTTDRAKLTPDWDDVSYITASVVDSNDVLVPDATDLVSFKLSGVGRIVAVDSGDNSSHESFRADMRRAYQGQCIAILRATAPAGQIRLTASAPDLTPAALLLEVVFFTEVKLKFDFGSSQVGLEMPPGNVGIRPIPSFGYVLFAGFV